MADLSVTAASVLASASAQTSEGIAGATITAGQPLYADAADSGKLKPAQATSAKNAAVGVSLHGASSGQPIKYATRDAGFTPGATLVVGTVYCVSAAAGGISPFDDMTTGDYVTVLGVAATTSVMKLDCNAALRAGAPVAA